MNMDKDFSGMPNKDQFSDEQQKMMKKRGRIDNLREKDNHYEDSVHDIAEKEGTFREKLAESGIDDQVVADQLADYFSDETVEKVEAQKDRWEDILTGLRNRNAYNKEIPQLIEMSKRQEQECAFLMLDFDHFKKVNDEYGHGAGDASLKQMADTIKGEVRATDGVYRYGGEEFVVYLPNADVQVAKEIAERIRSSVEESDIVVQNHDGDDVVLKKTISVGCVGTDQIDNWQEIDVEKLLVDIGNYSDRALYASKNNGRNQVTIFSEELEDVGGK